jgi:hypothetical protein
MAAGPSFTAETVIARGERAVHGELPQETVLVDLETGRSLRLNATAAWLWRRLENPSALSDLAAGLAAEFEADPGRALEDVQAFAADLAARGLVEVKA